MSEDLSQELTLFDNDQLVMDRKEQLAKWIATRDSRMMDFSYSFLTTGFQKLPIYGKRLVYRLMEYVYDQQALYGQTIDKDFEIGKWADEDITLNIRDLLASDKDSNYRQVKEYVKGLMSAVTEESNSKGDVRLSHFIQSCDLETSGKIIIRIDRRVWEKLLDFASGFERGDLEILLQCEGEYTPLAYLLFATENMRNGRTVESLTFNIDTLRKIFCLDEPDDKGRIRYPKAYDFVKNVIAPPAVELARFSPWTYAFTTEKGADGRGRPGIKKVTFYRKHILANEPTIALQQQISVRSQIDPYIYECLTHKLSMSNKEIRNNITLITDLQKRDLAAFQSFMERNIPLFVRADNPIAYAIGSMKKYSKNIAAQKEQAEAGRRRGGEAIGLGDIIGDISKF